MRKRIVLACVCVFIVSLLSSCGPSYKKEREIKSLEFEKLVINLGSFSRTPAAYTNGSFLYANTGVNSAGEASSRIHLIDTQGHNTILFDINKGTNHISTVEDNLVLSQWSVDGHYLTSYSLDGGVNWEIQLEEEPWFFAERNGMIVVASAQYDKHPSTEWFIRLDGEVVETRTKALEDGLMTILYYATFENKYYAAYFHEESSYVVQMDENFNICQRYEVDLGKDSAIREIYGDAQSGQIYILSDTRIYKISGEEAVFEKSFRNAYDNVLSGAFVELLEPGARLCPNYYKMESGRPGLCLPVYKSKMGDPIATACIVFSPDLSEVSSFLIPGYKGLYLAYTFEDSFVVVEKDFLDRLNVHTYALP